MTIRRVAAAAVSILVAASAARADAPSSLPAPGAAPAWLLLYTAVTGGARVRVTRYVSAHADGTVTWQQLDVDAGIADNGPMHRCTGAATLVGDELRVMDDAVQVLKEPRRDPSVAGGGHGGVAVALVVPRGGGGGQADVTSLNFDPDASGADPRLKRAAAILSRYRCPK